MRIFVLVLLVLCAGCRDTAQDTFDQNVGQHSPLGRLKFVDGPLTVGTPIVNVDLYMVVDTETGNEFIVVVKGDATAITAVRQ